MTRRFHVFFGMIFTCTFLVQMKFYSPAQSASFVFQEPREYLMRLSMDLRGTHPSEDEFRDYADTGLFDAFIDQCMSSALFYNRTMWMANDIFLTRTNFVEFFMESYNYNDEKTRVAVAKTIGEEPLRLFAYLVKNDRALTELVTADYTITNATLAWFWNIDYLGDPGGEQWVRGRYRDGRPHAGVLSQSSFYYRYGSTFTNKQRQRANAITRIFLDDDHFFRNISIDLRLGASSSMLDLDEATLTNPSCLACHSTLDGIGAHLEGFSLGPAEISFYARQNFGAYGMQGSKRYLVRSGRIPSYYGYPSGNLKDLGNYIAQDPRFAWAMVKHIYRFLNHRSLDYRDRDLLIHFTDILKNNHYNTKSLIKAIVTSDEYKAVGYIPDSTGIMTVKASGKTNPETIRVSQWQEASDRVRQTPMDNAKKLEWLQMINKHQGAAFDSHWISKYPEELLSVGLTSSNAMVFSPSYNEIIQPFKLATPEQLHILGSSLTGEIWNGNEGGGELSAEFASLEYNTDYKVAAGGYDGILIKERRYDIPASYLLVQKRWAEVLVGKVIRRELEQSVPWGQRIVFKAVTGKEDFYEAEPDVRQQIADWFKLFYNKKVHKDSPEVDDVFGILLQAREEARAQYGDTDSIRIAWQQILIVLLSDIQAAVY